MTSVPSRLKENSVSSLLTTGGIVCKRREPSRPTRVRLGPSYSAEISSVNHTNGPFTVAPLESAGFVLPTKLDQHTVTEHFQRATSCIRASYAEPEVYSTKAFLPSWLIRQKAMVFFVKEHTGLSQKLKPNLKN
jgi:hypothetical protein